MFGDSLQETRNEQQKEHEERQENKNKEISDKEHNPVNVEQIEFDSARTLERILNRVAKQILPNNLLLKQLNQFKKQKAAQDSLQNIVKPHQQNAEDYVLYVIQKMLGNCNINKEMDPQLFLERRKCIF